MLRHPPPCTCLFFFNDTATTEIYTLSLHDALPIWGHGEPGLEPAEHADDELPAVGNDERDTVAGTETPPEEGAREPRSEEHTSELQSLAYLVCRLLLEKKKTE